MELHMNQDDIIVSKTDLKGRITYGNEYFIKMSGYDETELLDAPHNILRHEGVPKIVFKLLWDRVSNKQHINAYVKNKTKNGDFYWVFANVTASVDNKNNIVGYYSVRRKPSSNGIETMDGIYKALLQAELRGGVSESAKLLEDTLRNAGVSYDEFVINLQK